MHSIRAHFFRMMARAGIGAAIIASVGVLLSGYFMTRHHAIHHFEQVVQQAGDFYALTALQKNRTPLKNYLQHVAQNENLTRICMYDPQNRLTLQWQEANVIGTCPVLLAASGMQTSTWSVRRAQPITDGTHYLGMIQAEGMLSTLRAWLWNAGALLSGLLILCWMTCRISSRWMAQSLTQQLNGIRQQIECLKDNDIAFCPLSTEKPLAEISALSTTIIALRAYLDTSKVPKETLMKLTRWHWEILTGLLAELRHQLDAGSPLLEYLSDYALLMQTQRGDSLPTPKRFDIARVLDRSAVAARKHNPRPAQINFTASLQSNTPREWLGQPEILETLLRHLLMIGLKRTKTGFVYLRLHAISDQCLHIAYEDSGPPIQPWQLLQWLATSQDESLGNYDISWLLVARLFQRLGGRITGRSGVDGGLMLEGSVALQVAHASTDTAPAPIRPLPGKPPLLLVVEKEQAAEGKIAALLTQAGCRSFTVSTHAQLLEWVTALPVCAIILNDTLPDEKDDVIRRLLHMKQNGTIGDIPCWVVSTTHSFIEADYWRQRGITQQLQVPIAIATVQEICATLPSPDAQFYQMHHARVRDDFTAAITESLPRMTEMLGVQVRQLSRLLETRTQDDAAAAIGAQAHAVKSAALTLGYLPLAALMGQMEHHAASRHFSAGNWVVIAECLAEFLAGIQAKTLPSAA